METLILYTLMCSSLYYLGTRATITEGVWSKYPAWLARFMDCSACSGFWYGIFVGIIGGYGCGLSFLGLPGNAGGTVIAVALCSITLTPIVAALMQYSLNSLGSAVDPEQTTEKVE